jgi:hypothetical protein
MPKSGEISTDLKMIATGFTDVVSIGTYDNQFIYVADSTQGFFAIESFTDDEFSQPRPITITVEGKSDSPKPISMVVFTLDAIVNFSLSLTAILVIVSLSLF